MVKTKLVVLFTLMLSCFSLTAEELALGSKYSKVTLIEYGSLTCDHCIGFHRKVLPELKKNYIESGKVKFIYRHYPTSKVALQAAIAAECSGDKYYEMLDDLYNNVAKWYSSRKPGIWFQEKAVSLGVDGKSFETCYFDKNVRQNILNEQKEGFDTFGVKGTPTFLINGEVISGKQTYQALKTIIDKRLSE